jgi:hypothetical protein
LVFVGGDERGTTTVRRIAQGSGVSPILANVFLHYVVDLWVHQWRGRRATGTVIVCRYADDMVFGCQFEADGKQLLVDLKDRLLQFGLRTNLASCEAGRPVPFAPFSPSSVLPFRRFALKRPSEHTWEAENRWLGAGTEGPCHALALTQRTSRTRA